MSQISRALRIAGVLSLFIGALISWDIRLLKAQADPKNASEQLRKLVKNRLTSLEKNNRQYISGEPLHSFHKLMDFYARRDLRAAWLGESGVKPFSEDLLSAIRSAPKEGLEPKDYHVDLIATLIRKIQDRQDKNKTSSISDLSDLEIILSDSFLTYGSHLLAGRVDPNKIDEEWIANRRDANLPEILEQAFEGEKVRALLKDLLPTQKAYGKLRQALSRYHQIEKEGGWGTIPEGPAIKLGQKDPRVKQLQRRLRVEGDLHQIPNDNGDFDESIERALVRFQKRHGFDPDGILGEETRGALNIPVEKRIQQIALNMERCRWLPEDLGSKYILINIAGFTLQVVENEEPVMKMKVVVGKRYRRTPVFSSTLKEIVLNPTWTVPKKIARLDLLPKIQKNRNFLAEENFAVYDSYDENARIVEWKNVDWSSMTAQNLTFKFRQRPGPKNALGRIKFLIANDFDVYLHDTPSRELFNKSARFFSSGCIRVENPIELAEYLLHSNPRWSKEAILAAIGKKEEQFLALAEPIPVHLLYWTAWVDERGKMQFRNDIYRRDERLEWALAGKPLENFIDEKEEE